MLGTVHQHLFHAVVCSDFILPDTHCTVHWIIQENERIGWSWCCSTRKGAVNESYKEKINRGLINGWDHMMITEPLYRSSNKNDRMGTLLSAWNKSSGLKSCNLLPHWTNLLLADFFSLHHFRKLINYTLLQQWSNGPLQVNWEEITGFRWYYDDFVLPNKYCLHPYRFIVLALNNTFQEKSKGETFLKLPEIKKNILTIILNKLISNHVGQLQK